MREREKEQELADLLMSGPRGRRLLLEYAVRSEQLHDSRQRGDSFALGVFYASYELDPGKGTSVKLFGPGAADVGMIENLAVSADEVARRLDSISLAGANSTLLRDCLAASCDNARYWQEPDGTDVLAATDSMMRSLTRVAEHVASSHCTSWWRQPVQRNEQWSTTWEGDFDASPSIDPIGLLRSTRAGIIEEERTAHIERPADPTANWSGDWWSSPAAALTSSTRLLDGTSPANLWFVEDSFGWDHAQTIKVKIPREANIYEIDSADAWASLCKRFPIEVTAQVRHDWYRTTGRAGMWVMPDWLRVAEHYNAVHLQVQAYLCAAGTAIPITEHTASVIAGWNPDQTYWFTPEIAWSGDAVRWERREDDGWYICG